MGNNVINGVMEFFKTCKMLRLVNNIVITLVPKSTHADVVDDYRPISCCNIIYKVISKMLCNILKKVQPKIISNNQSAFIAGRSIAHNILICQDLVGLNKRKNTTRSCLINVCLRKAYDNVEWRFVEDMLHALNFPQRFIRWIMGCITSTSTL